MKILAIIDVAPDARMESIRNELASEIKESWALFASGMLREAYATAAPSRVVFVLEADDVSSAEEHLRKSRHDLVADVACPHDPDSAAGPLYIPGNGGSRPRLPERSVTDVVGQIIFRAEPGNPALCENMHPWRERGGVVQ
jgi:hypothetical protein